MSAFKKGPAAMDIANILLRENADLHARVKRLEEAIRKATRDLLECGPNPRVFEVGFMLADALVEQPTAAQPQKEVRVSVDPSDPLGGKYTSLTAMEADLMDEQQKKKEEEPHD